VDLGQHRGLSITALFVAAIVTAAAASMEQLTERPTAGALAHPAIGYYATPTHDVVAGLNRKLEDGSAQVAYDEQTGYLRSVLDALHVPVESQMLVMSKTGVQGLYTSPANPRAIYFNDAVTVGYIRGAPLLELAVQDPQQGVVFYAIDQKPQARPIFGSNGRLIPITQWNQFGGSFGGPIKRNKTFVFGDYQGTRRNIGGSVLLRVPTAAERSGDLSALNVNIFDPASATGLAGRTQFPGNVIPPSRLASQSQKLLALVPLPNSGRAHEPLRRISLRLVSRRLALVWATRLVAWRLERLVCPRTMRDHLLLARR